MYYTGMGTGRPTAHAQGYILSAVSPDASTWTKEAGVRLDVGVHPRSAVSSEHNCSRTHFLLLAVPFAAFGCCWCKAAKDVSCVARRVQLRAVCPDVVLLPDGRWRMYWEGRSAGLSNVVLSAVSADGLQFEAEAGWCAVCRAVCHRRHISVSPAFAWIGLQTWSPETLCLTCHAMVAAESKTRHSI